MKALGIGLSVLAFGSVGTLGFLGYQRNTILTDELKTAQEALTNLTAEHADAVVKIGEITTAFEQYSTSTSERLDTLKRADVDTRDKFHNRLQDLDEEIAHKLLGHVKKDEVSRVLEEYRNKTIENASSNVVYVVNTAGTGSGFFINDSGRVLTNAHVVQHAKQVQLMTWDEHWIDADIIAVDAATDIAVLQVVDKDVEFLKGRGALPGGCERADSDKIETGDYVFAMGAPHRLTQTVNAGQVSNTSRFLPGMPILDKVSGLYNLYFQIDAGVMPGNSGGPSFDIEGRVIGINSRANHQNEAEGFVIPINFVMERVESMLSAEDHANHYNTLGFHINPYFRRMNEAGNRPKILPKEYESALQVGRVFNDSPAFQKKFRTGDLILEVDGKPLELNVQGDVVAVRRAIAFGKPGTEHTFKVKHMPKMSRGKIVKKGKIEEITIAVVDGNEYSMPVGVNTLRGYFNNVALDEMPEGYEGGVKFVSPYNMMDSRKLRGQVSAAFPFKNGDIVVAIEGKDIDSLGTLTERLQQIIKGRRPPSSVSVVRGGSKIDLKPTMGRTQPNFNNGTKKPTKPKRKTEIF